MAFSTALVDQRSLGSWDFVRPRSVG